MKQFLYFHNLASFWGRNCSRELFLFFFLDDFAGIKISCSQMSTVGLIGYHSQYLPIFIEFPKEVRSGWKRYRYDRPNSRHVFFILSIFAFNQSFYFVKTFILRKDLVIRYAHLISSRYTALLSSDAGIFLGQFYAPHCCK